MDESVNTGFPVDLYVGTAIKRARLRRGVKSCDLAGAVGISPSVLDAYEAGQKEISAHELFYISKFLEVEIDDLFPPNEEDLSYVPASAERTELRVQ